MLRGFVYPIRNKVLSILLCRRNLIRQKDFGNIYNSRIKGILLSSRMRCLQPKG